MMLKITYVEAKLYLRDWTILLFVVVLPLGLMLTLGQIPGWRETGVVSGHLPSIMTLLSAGILGLISLPTYLASYRQSGVLRRMSATPARPGSLLSALLLIHTVVALLVAAVLVIAGALVLRIAVPSPLGWFILTLVTGAASFLAIGLLIGVLAPSGPAASGIGNALVFPLFFLGGMWMRREDMPGALGTISDLSPMGPFVRAMRETWVGQPPQLQHLLITAGYGLVAALVAVRLFRWE